MVGRGIGGVSGGVGDGVGGVIGRVAVVGGVVGSFVMVGGVCGIRGSGGRRDGRTQRGSDKAAVTTYCAVACAGRCKVDVGGVVLVSWWSAVSVEAVAAEVEEGSRGFGRGIGGAAVGVGDGVGDDVKRWGWRWHR